VISASFSWAQRIMYFAETMEECLTVRRYAPWDYSPEWQCAVGPRCPATKRNRLVLTSPTSSRHTLRSARRPQPSAITPRSPNLSASLPSSHLPADSLPHHTQSIPRKHQQCATSELCLCHPSGARQSSIDGATPPRLTSVASPTWRLCWLCPRWPTPGL